MDWLKDPACFRKWTFGVLVILWLGFAIVAGIDEGRGDVSDAVFWGAFVGMIGIYWLFIGYVIVVGLYDLVFHLVPGLRGKRIGPWKWLWETWFCVPCLLMGLCDLFR